MSAPETTATAASTSRRNSFAPVEFTPAVAKECLKQVEFYFSEFNFPYDRFLRTTADKNDGWVPIGSIATFNRMKKFRPIEKVVETLRTSEVLEVSADGENVKRRVPLDLNKDKEARLEQNKRTIAVMNIPHDDETAEGAEGAAAATPVDLNKLQLQLEELFGKLGEVNQVRLLRVNRKKFKGTALVEFKTLETCEDVVKNYSGASDADSKEILSLDGHKLEILTKKQYNMQREATRSKNFGGAGQRSRSFTGHRKNMPKVTPPKEDAEESAKENAEESAIADDKE